MALVTTKEMFKKAYAGGYANPGLRFAQKAPSWLPSREGSCPEGAEGWIDHNTPRATPAARGIRMPPNLQGPFFFH